MSACPSVVRVDAHHEGRLVPAEARALFEHLPECAECRARYDRLAILDRLDPEAREARVARALGFGAAPRRPRVATLAPWLAAAAAVALVAGLTPWTRSNDRGFTVRGAPIAEARDVLQIYRVAAAGRIEPIADTMQKGDELCFAYENLDGRRYFGIFGVDERGQVHWYHPAWARAVDTPRLAAASTTPGPVELREAIAHPLEAGRLRIYLVLTDDPLDVHDVEAAVEMGPPLAARVELPRTEQAGRTLDVR
jgi:hypothetical protein